MNPNPYGSTEYSNSNPYYNGDLLSQKPAITALLDSGATTLRAQTDWEGIEQAYWTTSATPINSTGVATITVATMLPNFIVGAQVLVDIVGSQQETCTLTAMGSTTITMNFTKTHTGTFYPHQSGTLYPIAVIPLAGDTPNNCGSPPRVQPYNWTVVDDLVALHQATGLLIDFVIQSSPVWHTATDPCQPAHTVIDPNAIGAFATALLSRYPPGTFYAIEPGNEAFNDQNCTAMFTTQVAPILAQMRTLINQYSPTTLLGSPAQGDNNLNNTTAWFNQFYSAGCHHYADYLQIHYYNGTSSPFIAVNPGDGSLPQLIAAIQTVQTTYQDLGRPIQLNEWGYGGISDSIFASYASETLSIAQRAPLGKILIFTITSLAPGAGANQDFTQSRYLVWKNFIKLYPQWPIVLPTNITYFVRGDAATGAFVPHAAINDYSPIDVGDTEAPHNAQFLHAVDGSPVSLAGATITTKMKNVSNQAVQTWGGTWVIDNASDGRAHYPYQSADVATPGLWLIETTITIGNKPVHADLKLLEILSVP